MIMLGDLSVTDIENRLSIEFTEEERKFLNDSRQSIADVKDPNQWHCFDIPLCISCGSMDMAIKVRDILAPYSAKMKGTIQIGLSNPASKSKS